jgi:hypothetical protein
VSRDRCCRKGAGREWGRPIAGGDGAAGASGKGAVVEQEELGGEGARVGGAGVRGEREQPLSEQPGVGGKPLVCGVLRVGDLDSSGKKGAAARWRLRPMKALEGVEDRQRTLVRVGAAALQSLVPRRAPSLVAPAQVGRDEVILAREVRVERRRCDLGTPQYGIDAGRGDTPLVEQLLSGVQQTLRAGAFVPTPLIVIL